MEFEYESVLLKELVENWREDSGLYAPDMLCDHLEELFGKGDYKVTSAQVDGSHLELQIKSSKWKGDLRVHARLCGETLVRPSSPETRRVN